MRAYLLLGIIFGSIPFCFFRPYIGIIMWVWIGLMNPHQLAWRLHYPVAFIVAIPTLLGTLFFRNQRYKFPFERETWILIILLVYFSITTLFAIYPNEAIIEWNRVWKIYLMTFISLFLFQDTRKLRYLIMIMALSIAFFGVKGAIFSILSGGQYIIYGPQKSFIADNNALALAELIVLPLLYYLAQEEKNKWVKRSLYTITILVFISIIFSYSRGAFLALFMLTVCFILIKSNKRLLWLFVLFFIFSASIPFIPKKWIERMETITTYQEDKSATGRINAWWFAYNIANERPFIGGGFRVFRADLFAKYAPDPNSIHDAHSIYFEVLGEHGYIALCLFISLLLSSYLSLKNIQKKCLEIKSLDWALHYSIMLRLSLIAYAVGGTFLGLAYFDLYYYLIAAVILLKVIVEKQLESKKTGKISID